LADLPDDVCVFCGSQGGRAPVYLEAARAVGRTLAGAGIGLVYGGGRTGMMGAVADAALAAGGRVVGIIPAQLKRREVGHEGLTELLVVRSMHERKQLMADRAGAFVMLAGGFGTFEEFCEILTWAQLGMHAKPCVLVNTAAYYAPLIAMFDRALGEGFLRAEHRGLVQVVDGADGLLAAFATWEPPQLERWMTVEDA
jgi:uncharacterized protein (TIGR00730 family)